MSLRGLLPRRGGFWLLLLLLAASYLISLRKSEHEPAPSYTDAPSALDVESPGDTPEARAESQYQRQAQRAHGEADRKQDVLRDTEGTAEDNWGWGWAGRVKEKLGWTADEEDENGLVLHDDTDATEQQPHDAFEAKYGSRQADLGAKEVEDSQMAYHNHLEKEHGPHEYTKHSPTLTFDHIYVVSLPRRTDRRERMDKIAHALGLRFTYVDALSRDVPVLGWIAERVAEVRQRKRPILASALGVPEDQIGGMGVDSQWLKTADRRIGLHFPDLKTLDYRWQLVKGKPVPEGDPRTEGEGRAVDWVTYLEKTEDLETLQPSQSPLDIQALLHDPVEKLEARQINDAVLATWFSQVKAWKKVLENKDSSALILEDDVDLEWDIERIWPNIEKALPDSWEIVLLGHCWGHEMSRHQYVHPLLHRATDPRCLHGYALSQKGARHLLSLALDPWRAYQTPIDTLVPFHARISPVNPAVELKAKSHIYAYSLEPPLIIQSKELSSDIQDGVGSTWRGLLADSTWNRVLRDEGKQVKQLTWEDIKMDPAIKPRPWSDARKIVLQDGVSKQAAVQPPPRQPGELVMPDEGDASAGQSPVDGAPLPGNAPEDAIEFLPPAPPTEEEEEMTLAEEEAALSAEQEAADAALAAEAKAALREKGMARVVDAEERERERLLEMLPKKPAALVKGKNRQKPDAVHNEKHAAAEMQAVVDALKKGEKPKKGAGDRVGTGPKRLGVPKDEARRRR